jgi:hypothetical protein
MVERYAETTRYPERRGKGRGERGGRGENERMREQKGGKKGKGSRTSLAGGGGEELIS